MAPKKPAPEKLPKPVKAYSRGRADGLREAADRIAHFGRDLKEGPSMLCNHLAQAFRASADRIERGEDET